jgi:hypothetical protein
MANTYVDYTGDNSETDFIFNFDYLQNDHVKVKVNDVIVTNYSIVEVSADNVIRFDTAPASNASIRIYRDSRGDFSPLVDFVDGSVLTQVPLDQAYKHNLFVSQEASEGTGNELLNKKGGANYDAEGNKIINLGTPTTGTDAANKGYVDQTIDNSIALGGSPAIVSLGGYDVTAFGTSITKSLANWTNDLNSPTATGSTTARSLADRFAQESLHVFDFGAVGDATADDTNAFKAAITYCKANNKVLDITGARLYLSSLDAPIDITNLTIEASNNAGLSEYLDSDYIQGISDNFAAHLSGYQSSTGASAIISNYNGAIFTGFTFRVRGCSIRCNPTKPNSSAFVQTTPTTYPQASSALNGDYKGLDIWYCGSHGIELKGGLETERISRLTILMCKGNGLHVNVTAGVNSPVEYLTFTNCTFEYCDTDSVYFETATKHIIFDRCRFNGAGKYLSDYSPSTHTDIKYAIRIKPVVGFTGLHVTNSYGEQLQGLLYIDGGYVYDIKVENNVLFYDDVSYARYALTSTASTIRGLRVSSTSFHRNNAPIYLSSLTTDSYGIELDTRVDIAGSTGVTTAPITAFTPSTAHEHLEKSGSLGDGTAGTFTYTITDSLASPSTVSPGTYQGAYTQVYAITASWQATNSDQAGTYLFTVSKLPSGSYMGFSVATSSTAGFIAAPTISTSGVISVPLSQNFRGRIIRIDASQTKNFYSY